MRFQCLEHLAQTALADSRFVAAVRRTPSNFRPAFEPDEYLRAPVSTPAKSILGLLCLYSRNSREFLSRFSLLVDFAEMLRKRKDATSAIVQIPTRYQPADT
jgi:hypothetical protein